MFLLQRDVYDTANFDSDFTRMTPNFTPIPSQSLSAVNQAEFKGFSFINKKFGEFNVQPADPPTNDAAQDSNTAAQSTSNNNASAPQTPKSPTSAAAARPGTPATISTDL